jgi:hypothetical protein
MRQAKARKWKAPRVVASLSSLGPETAKARRPGEAFLHYAAARQQHEAAFGLGVFDDFQLDAVLGCGVFGRFSAIALLHVGQLYILLGNLLDLPGQFADLCAVLFIGRGDMRCQKMAQRIHGRMNLRSLAPFGSVVAGSRTRLRRRLQGAAVQDHRSRFPLAPRKLTQEHAPILHHGFEAAGPDPALRLLINHRPGRQIVGHVTPLTAAAYHVAQSVEHRAADTPAARSPLGTKPNTVPQTPTSHPSRRWGGRFDHASCPQHEQLRSEISIPMQTKHQS